MVLIRKAHLEDIYKIREIYNEAVLNTTATFDTEEKSLETMMQWFLDREEYLPVYVAEVEEKVVGYVSLNRWSAKKAYDITAEISLYIEPQSRGKGTGKRLIDFMVKTAMGQGKLHSLIARITQGNEHSIYLHESNGFVKIGVISQAGQKFGELLDVTILQKML